MRYWYDCEFIEDGKTIDLISIGIVAEDGREYYAQSVEFNPKKASLWVWENVLPHLVICPHENARNGQIESALPKEIKLHAQGQCLDQFYGLRHRCPWRSRDALQRDILRFMDTQYYGTPELWGYYSAYDHVALCQLFGTMMDLPKGFPMYTRDVKQWADALSNPKLPEQSNLEHNALYDAQWNKQAWEWLRDYEARSKALDTIVQMSQDGDEYD